MFEEALKQAKELDDEFAATGHIHGPLHGVPISIKDQCTLQLFPFVALSHLSLL